MKTTAKKPDRVARMGRPKLAVDTSTYAGRFAARLCELREEKKLEAQEVADRVGVTRKALYHWERGIREPNLSQINALAKALGVTVRRLMPDR